jgi:hypothetical protein
LRVFERIAKALPKGVGAGSSYRMPMRFATRVVWIRRFVDRCRGSGRRWIVDRIRNTIRILPIIWLVDGDRVAGVARIVGGARVARVRRLLDGMFGASHGWS